MTPSGASAHVHPFDTRDLDGNEVTPYADGRERGSMAQYLGQGR